MGADVKNIEAVERARAAYAMFGDEAAQSLAAAQTDVAKFLQWLAHDQLRHWKLEIERRERTVERCHADLHRALTATIDPNHTPSAYQEKKALARAKLLLEEAREKLASVRRWVPKLEQAIFEFRMRIEPLENAVVTLVPEGLAQLSRTAERLWAYTELTPPETASALASVVRAGEPEATQPHAEGNDDAMNDAREDARKRAVAAAHLERDR